MTPTNDSTVTSQKTSARLWGLSNEIWLVVAVILGLALRLYYAAVKAGMHYPDELYQYLEPAYWHIHGFGDLVWEYERGVRNWILPSYYGGLIEIGEAIGLHTWRLHRFLAYHNAILSVLVVPAGFRLGRHRQRGAGDLRDVAL